MNHIREFLAETDFRDTMYFVMSLALPFIGGYAGAWLALHMAGPQVCW